MMIPILTVLYVMLSERVRKEKHGHLSPCEVFVGVVALLMIIIGLSVAPSWMIRVCEIGMVFICLYKVIVLCYSESSFIRKKVAAAAFVIIALLWMYIGAREERLHAIQVDSMQSSGPIGGKTSAKPCQIDAHACTAIPTEILGLQTLVTGSTDGMIRKTESRRLGGKEYEIGYLEDEVPRKVDGPIFASAKIRCTEKTRQTVGLIADTGIMLQSDEQAVMDIAQTVAGEVGRVCGFEMKHPIYSSIRSRKSDIVTLYSGHGGNFVAEVLWVRQGKEKGFLRLLLHDTGSVSEKSPLYAEIMAN